MSGRGMSGRCERSVAVQTRCFPSALRSRPVETTVHELHGVRRVDDYGWLRDKDSARTREYLSAERAFYDARPRT